MCDLVSGQLRTSSSRRLGSTTQLSYLSSEDDRLLRVVLGLTLDSRHWQLRQVVSSPNANTLVYTAEGTIYCLDTSTLKCDRIASLSYAARCLATGHDWVCVGGEDGQFTAVQLQANQTLAQESSLRQAQVDALLPVELDPEARRRATQYLSSVEGRLPSARQRRSTFPINEQLGSSITNSITIHKPNKPRASAKDWERDDTVAVLT